MNRHNEVRRERKGFMGCAHNSRSAEFKTESQADTFAEFDPILLLFCDACFPGNCGMYLSSLLSHNQTRVWFWVVFPFCLFDAKPYQGLGCKEKVVRVPRAEFPIAKKGMLHVQQVWTNKSGMKWVAFLSSPGFAASSHLIVWTGPLSTGQIIMWGGWRRMSAIL